MIFVTDNQVTLFLNGGTLSTHLLILFQINISLTLTLKKIIYLFSVTSALVTS